MVVHEHHVPSSQVILHHSLTSLACLLSHKCALLQNSWRGACLLAEAAGTAYTPPNTRRPTVHYLQHGQGNYKPLLSVRHTHTLARIKASLARRAGSSRPSMGQPVLPAVHTRKRARAAHYQQHPSGHLRAAMPVARLAADARRVSRGTPHELLQLARTLAETPPGPMSSCCKIDATTVTADLPSATLPSLPALVPAAPQVFRVRCCVTTRTPGPAPRPAP